MLVLFILNNPPVVGNTLIEQALFDGLWDNFEPTFLSFQTATLKASTSKFLSDTLNSFSISGFANKVLRSE